MSLKHVEKFIRDGYFVILKIIVIKVVCTYAHSYLRSELN
jgi:hypothetical protein